MVKDEQPSVRPVAHLATTLSELTYVCGRRLGEEGRGGEEREGRGGEERAAAASTGSSKALEEEDEVKGSYSTKIVALGIAVPWYH
jgi:hypothetical protein